MSKIIKYSGVLLVLIGLVGCSFDAPTSIVDELLYDNRIVVGVSPDYPPFQYLDNRGEVMGFEVDLLQALVAIVNRNNGLDLDIEYRQMAFEMLVSAIQTRQVDIGSSGFTYSPDRDGIFSETFFDSEQIVIVNKDSDITVLEDLENMRVGVGLGTTGEEAIIDIPGIRLTNSEYPIMFTALKSNSLDAVVSDLVVGNEFIEELDLVRLEAPVTIEEMKLLFRFDLKYLNTEFDKAILEFINSSEYDVLLEKWGLK